MTTAATTELGLLVPVLRELKATTELLRELGLEAADRED